MPSQRLLLAMLALLTLVTGALVAGVWMLAPGDGGVAGVAGARRDRAVPVAGMPTTSPPPPVAPVQYLDVSRDAARALNAQAPFSNSPIPPASPLRLTLASTDLSRAVDCLAAAGYYEAGDDGRGQQAVVQVVLNRLRHPSFPKTICGVVFEGSERSTGCQFSFTCDGSLTRRRPSASAWSRAQGAALAGVGGYVFVRVGYATHYHTDWVVPNWSANVDKIAQVQTHLFFRWRGSAGHPGAFRGVHAGAEPIVPAMAPLSPAHAAGADEAALASPDAAVDSAAAATAAIGAIKPPATPSVPVELLRGLTLVSATSSNNFVLATGDAGLTGGVALVALDLCRVGGEAECTVIAYKYDPTRDATPDFYYFRDTSRGVETVYWDCEKLKRSIARQCMPPGFKP